MLFDIDLEKEWVTAHLEKAGSLALQLLETQIPAFRALIGILGERLSLEAPALEAALMAAGIDVGSLLKSYPAALDYRKSLEEFMQKGEQNTDPTNW